MDVSTALGEGQQQLPRPTGMAAVAATAAAMLAAGRLLAAPVQDTSSVLHFVPRRRCGPAAMEGVETETAAAALRSPQPASSTSPLSADDTSSTAHANLSTETTRAAQGQQQQAVPAVTDQKATKQALHRCKADLMGQDDQVMGLHTTLRKLQQAHDLMVQMNRLIDKRDAAKEKHLPAGHAEPQQQAAQQKQHGKHKMEPLASHEDLARAVSTAETALRVLFQQLELPTSTTLNNIQRLRQIHENQLRKLITSQRSTHKSMQQLALQLSTQQSPEAASIIMPAPAAAGSSSHSLASVVWVGMGSNPQGLCTSDANGSKQCIRARFSCWAATWPSGSQQAEFLQIRSHHPADTGDSEAVMIEVGDASAYTLPIRLNVSCQQNESVI